MTPYVIGNQLCKLIVKWREQANALVDDVTASIWFECADELEAIITAGVPPAESDVIRAMLWPLLGLKPTVDTLGAAMKRINELSAGVPPEPSQDDNKGNK